MTSMTASAAASAPYKAPTHEATPGEQKAMGWAVGLAAAATVGALAIPLCAGLGAIAGVALPYLLILKANASTVTTMAATYLASQVWTSQMAMISGAVGAVVGTIGGVGATAVAFFDGKKNGAQEVEFHGMPDAMSGKLAAWRSQTGKTLVSAADNVMDSVSSFGM
jgi:hypothetical protein